VRILTGLTLSLPWLGVLFACAAAGRAHDPLDATSESYVRLVLAIGRHDANYVDAYYGPPEWSEEAKKGEPVPVAVLLQRARGLLEDTRRSPATERRDFLEKQLVAAECFLRKLGGEKMTLAEEGRLLYDIDAPVHTAEEFEAARSRLESIVPGTGGLEARVKAFRDRFAIPRDRLDAVVRACLDRSRRRTLELTPLPASESFEVAFVQGKPWSAYNWYRGGFRSLIEINTDLPSELGRIFHTISHEGYPGHHIQNVLIEETLVRGRGWREFTVYPLYSPQSLIAEGTANVGLSVLLTPDEQLAFKRDVLAKLAGVAPAEVGAYESVLEAMKPLDFVRGEAARFYLDGGRSERETLDFLKRYGLLDDDRAKKALDFIRTYRAYVFNYTAGEELVRAYVGTKPDRVQRFFDLLRSPATPSRLVSTVRGQVS
jgi:hypothetical protein